MRAFASFVSPDPDPVPAAQDEGHGDVLELHHEALEPALLDGERVAGLAPHDGVPLAGLPDVPQDPFQIAREAGLDGPRGAVPQLVEGRQHRVGQDRQRRMLHQRVRRPPAVGSGRAIVLVPGAPSNLVGASASAAGDVPRPFVAGQHPAEEAHRVLHVLLEQMPHRLLEHRHQQAPKVQPYPPQAHPTIHAVLKDAAEVGPFVDEGEVHAELLQIKGDPPRGPRVQEIRILELLLWLRRPLIPPSL
mmetsp:Transcript_2404/g.6060  ORF Transcript_2404/g.6060 Transcript_2404/m.6060 type:complete len:247 (+) Transcript_2404:722-1462(+)